MAKWKVVITDRQFAEINIEKEILSRVDAEVFDYQVKDEKDVIAIVGDCDAVITEYADLTRKAIESMSKCQIISIYAVGVDGIDLRAATDQGICVGHVLDYCVDEVSTHAVALTLNLTRKITLLNNTVREGHWDFKLAGRILNLRGLTFGLNGYGTIARAVAEKMKPFGVEIIACDPFVSPEDAEKSGVKLVDFKSLLEKSDIISSHVPDLPTTKKLFNEEAFRMMKKSAFLINTGRGPVVDEAGLIRALETGEIAGAAMDVTDPEPIAADSPLLSMKNVIITPHSGYNSEDSQKRLQALTAENVAQRLMGYCPRYFANRELKDKLGLMDLPEGGI